MTILVTGAGANSFLGKNIIDFFEKKPINPLVKDFVAMGSEFDLTKADEADELVKLIRPNILIHAAAKCGGIYANIKSPATFIRDNILMGVNILDACVKYSVEYLITLGSVCSYPLNCPIPFRETDLFNGRSESSNEPYGESKKAMLTMQNAYRKQYGLKSIMLVPINLYAKYDHFDLENSHVVPALINKFVDAVENNKPTVYGWGSGKARRSFLNAKDLCNGLLKTIQYQPNEELPINIGPYDDISIKELANKIAYLTGFQGNIEFTGEVSDGQPRRILSIERAKSILNWEPQISLEEGLTETIKWYKENIYGKENK